MAQTDCTHSDGLLDRRSPAVSLRIVVADGDPAICQGHHEYLTRLGHQACGAATGRQLVEQCRLLRPDLVITAVHFPDLDGSTVADEVCREQPTPLILVPGEQDAGALPRALSNPYVLACLFKPVKQADLATAIALAMHRFVQIEALRSEAAELRQTLEDRKVIERAKGLVMRYAGLDEPEAFRRLRKLASDRNRKLVEIAHDIVIAAEIFQQLEDPGDGHKGDGHARTLGRGRPHCVGPPLGLAERKAPQVG